VGGCAELWSERGAVWLLVFEGGGGGVLKIMLWRYWGGREDRVGPKWGGGEKMLLSGNGGVLGSCDYLGRGGGRVGIKVLKEVLEIKRIFY